MKRIGLIAAILLVLSSSMVGAQNANTVQLGPLTQTVMSRGQLICGVNNTVRGFGFVNDAGQYSGFDVDFCRVFAAAIFGDATQVNFRPVTAADRQTVLQSGEVDLISRNSTFTLSRDTAWGASFAPTTFYDGQGVMVKSDSSATSLKDLEGATICTNAGTSTELNITDGMRNLGLDFQLQTYQDFNAVMATFNQGGCDAVTTDRSGLVSTKASQADPGSYKILDTVLSKEPLGPLSPQNDPQFADILRWSVYATIEAEELGITSKNIDTFLPTDGEADADYNKRVGANVARFLGYGNNQAGSYLGLDNHFTVNVIKQVGNYGEIYDRNLTPLGLARGLNDLWTKGGLLYSPPWV